MLDGVAGVLLVSPDWRTRALLRAQLIEEGCAVIALESLEDAESELPRSGFEPTLLIAELADDEPAASQIDRLAAWTGRVAVWVLATCTSGIEDQLRSHRFEEVIFRPFGIKELVDRIKQRLGAS